MWRPKRRNPYASKHDGYEAAEPPQGPRYTRDRARARRFVPRDPSEAAESPEFPESAELPESPEAPDSEEAGAYADWGLMGSAEEGLGTPDHFPPPPPYDDANPGLRPTHPRREP